MEHFPMELRLHPHFGRVVFRLAEPAQAESLGLDPETAQAWQELFWKASTGWLDRRRLTDEQVADWIPLHFASDPSRREVAEVFANAEQHQIAVRIPPHADRPDAEHRWLAWWLSEAGLTVELMTDEDISGWTPVYTEGEIDG